MTNINYFKGTWEEILKEVVRLSEPIDVDSEGNEFGLQDELFMINPDTGAKGCINIENLDYPHWKQMLPQALKDWVSY